MHFSIYYLSHQGLKEYRQYMLNQVTQAVERSLRDYMEYNREWK